MRRHIPVFAFLLVFLFGMGAVSAKAGTIGTRLQVELKAKTPQGLLTKGRLIPVIIIFADKVDVHVFQDKDRHRRRAKIVKALKNKSLRSQRALLRYLRKHNVGKERRLWLLNGLAAKVPANLVPRVAGLPGVEEVRLDYVITLPASGSAPPATPEWNLTAIKAPDLWAKGVTGSGAVVASLDTGVDVSHPDLNPRYRGGNNSWYDPYGQHATPADVAGHGTQTMGIMVGGSAGGTAIGVAPDARWIAVKIFDDAGNASVSAIHSGFQWLLDPDNNPATDDAPDVVNNSWGLGEDVNQCITEFQPDIQALKAAGIAVVFSAGNNGPASATSISPANNAAGFAIGAVSEGSAPGTYPIANFSSRGPSTCDAALVPPDPTLVFPEVVAPGVATHTSDLLGSYSNPSGTSFAAPHISGVMALLLSAFPNTPVVELETVLQDNAQDLGSLGPDEVYGHGLVDALAAYNVLYCASSAIDSDADGIPNICDNCTLAANGTAIPDAGGNSQLDTDGDGYGNACDADLNGDNVTNFADFLLLRGQWGATGQQNEDLNGDGIVNFADFLLLRQAWGQPPGPSGLAP